MNHNYEISPLSDGVTGSPNGDDVVLDVDYEKKNKKLVTRDSSTRRKMTPRVPQWRSERLVESFAPQRKSSRVPERRRRRKEATANTEEGQKPQLISLGGWVWEKKESTQASFSGVGQG